MDPDPDPNPVPVIFVSDLIFFQSFFAYYFLKVHLHHFSKIKSHKKPKKSLYLKAVGNINDTGTYRKNSVQCSGSVRYGNDLVGGMWILLSSTVASRCQNTGFF